MKQIPLLQGKALLIEMPEGATNLKVLTVHQGSKSFPSLKYDRSDLVRGFIDLPPGNWRIIGMLSEVTEEQASGLVEGFGDITWLDYITRLDCHSALESLESSILAEGWYFENPHGEEPTHLEHMRAGWLDNPITDDVRRVWNWKEAQSRVLDRSRCLLLGRADEN